MDWKMPGIDGIETGLKIHEMSELAERGKNGRSGRTAHQTRVAHQSFRGHHGPPHRPEECLAAPLTAVGSPARFTVENHIGKPAETAARGRMTAGGQSLFEQRYI